MKPPKKEKSHFVNSLPSSVFVAFAQGITPQTSRNNERPLKNITPKKERIKNVQK
jgi:hypothetical protein|tara:strand:- start:212 stop:376 length:165 start_codon:yes stop_codon:yes gene_type:complete